MSVRLFVLGLIEGREIHGYEIKEVARLWGLERWASIGFGSIYHALGKLEEESLIVEKRVEQDGGRPPRTVYAITEPGRDAFFSLLRETLRSARPETRDIDLGLAFVHRLAPTERVALLTERLDSLRPRFDELRFSVERFERARVADSDARAADPALAESRRLLREVPWVEAGVRHSLLRLRTELDWMRDVLADVADWPPTDAGAPPGAGTPTDAGAPPGAGTPTDAGA